MKAITVVGVIAGVFWLLSAWVLVDSLLGDRLPHDPTPVKHRIEAVKAGKFLSPEQLAECKYGETVAIRGPVANPAAPTTAGLGPYCTLTGI